ncbi:hypothetical protein WQ56_12370 [Luteimonas sp. FCS-9]|nr:hypothetical protein WQ56_12370 [Luteimonas sp. FCS-9]
MLALPGPRATRPGHERATLGWVASEVARLLGLPFDGFAAASDARPGDAYLVPQDTLTAAQAAPWGIADEAALLGGVVPRAFVASKLITHGLVDAGARAPEGWHRDLGAMLREVTFPGFSAFAADDVREACARVLHLGTAARVKLADGVGGGGQHVVRDAAGCERLLATLSPAQVAAGVVVETDVAAPATYSVGELRLGGRSIAYVGTQGLGRGRDGGPVYGGSTLCVVRGRMPDLLDVFVQPRLRRTVEMAIAYDRCTQAAYPGLLCSRRNYDVLWGSDRHGHPHGGVLEQSWRVGGATPAELAAFELLGREPALSRVLASTVERHGPVRVPPQADVYCALDDPRCGLITKYRHAGRDVDLPLHFAGPDGSAPVDP